MPLNKTVKKAGMLFTGSLLFFSLLSPPSNSNSAIQQITKTSQYSEEQKQEKQEFLQYRLKAYLFGIKILNRPVSWNRTTKEDDYRLEDIIKMEMKPNGGSYSGSLDMHEVAIKDPLSQEEPYEEYSYNVNAGEKVYKKNIRFYSGWAEIKNGKDVIIKHGKYQGVFSLVKQITQDNVKVGDVYKTKILFGENEYNLEIKVEAEGKGEKMDYRPPVEYKGNEYNQNYEAPPKKKEFYMDYNTYRMRVRIERLGGKKQIKDEIYLWIGKEGKNKGRIMQVDIIYSWAISAKLVLRQ